MQSASNNTYQLINSMIFPVQGHDGRKDIGHSTIRKFVFDDPAGYCKEQHRTRRAKTPAFQLATH